MNKPRKLTEININAREQTYVYERFCLKPSNKWTEGQIEGQKDKKTKNERTVKMKKIK